MKFLHLTAADHGGAGIGAWRLHDGLRANGHTSRLLALDKRSTDSDVIEIPGSHRLFRARRAASKSLLKFLANDDYYFQNQLLTPSPDPQDVLELAGFTPEVIVVHFISHFLSADDLVALQRATGAAIVWHLLDMAAMTGGCHYAWSCDGYRRSCGNCPALRLSHRGDLSARTHGRKAAALAQMRAVVVAGSSLLARQAADSSLFSAHPIRTVLLGVSPETFAPRDSGTERRAFNIQGRGPVIFFGAQRFGQRRKGMSLLLASLQRLAQGWPAGQPRPILLLAGDGRDFSELTPLGFECRQLGFIDTAVLARAYAAADVFACPSIEDSGPMMINESMMSGTPVVAFRMGVAEDLIETGVTGMIVPLGDVDQFAAALMTVLQWPEEKRHGVRDRCRAVAMEKCAAGTQVERFLAISKAVVAGAHGQGPEATGDAEP